MTVATTDSKTGTTGDFEALLGELDLLKASSKTDDKKIAIAAEDGKKNDDDKDGDNKDKDGNVAGKKTDDLKKSLTVTLEDGTTVEAEDGTELIKALGEKLDATVTQGAKTSTDMLKGLTITVELLKAQSALLKSYGEEIDTLKTQLNKVSGEGKGRKTVVTLHENKSATEAVELAKGGKGVDLNEFMLKACDKMKEGKLTGYELSILEAAANRGIQPSAELIQKVIG